MGWSNYAGCHNDVETPIDVDNNGVLFLNSHISAHDVTDGTSNTIYVGEKLSDQSDLGWMSGTRPPCGTWAARLRGRRIIPPRRPSPRRGPPARQGKPRLPPI